MEKQLTSEELQSIKSLQQQIQEATLQIGALEVKKLQLKQVIEKLQQSEETIAKNLSDKYGNGTLDVETGKLTVVES